MCYLSPLMEHWHALDLSGVRWGYIHPASTCLSEMAGLRHVLMWIAVGLTSWSQFVCTCMSAWPCTGRGLSVSRRLIAFRVMMFTAVCGRRRNASLSNPADMDLTGPSVMWSAWLGFWRPDPWLCFKGQEHRQEGVVCLTAVRYVPVLLLSSPRVKSQHVFDLAEVSKPGTTHEGSAEPVSIGR